MAAEPQPAVLESDVPLSRSVLWRMQRDFYAQRGLRAWTEDMVPQYITNNPFIAEIYSRVVLGFLRDCGGSAPLNILELGAGPGKFTYLFLKHLTARLRAEGIAAGAIRYLMTDSAANLPDAWRSNHHLAEFADAGILRFAQFEAGGEAAGPSFEAKGPLVVIANYVFDSLPQDAFVIDHDRLFEALVTTKTNGTPAKLSDLQISFANAPLSAARYEDAAWTDILEHYRTSLPGATLLFPAETLATLRQLGGRSDGRMLVLVADKGFVHEDTLRLVQGPPALEMHAEGSCFSQMVNFDAIGRYFEFTGGWALLPDRHSAGLNICAFLQGERSSDFPCVRAAYREIDAAFNPDDLFALLGWLEPHMDAMSIPQILAVLRLSRWDPVVLMRLFTAITRQLRGLTNAGLDLRNAVLNTWANHFPVTAAEKTMAFQCGVILLELRFFEEALPLFRASQEALGPSAPTSYNLGLCAIGLDRRAEALAFMTQACNLDPGLEPAKAARSRLEAGL